MTELLGIYKDFGYAGVLVLFIFFAGRHILAQNKACYEKYEAHMDASNEELKALTLKMFEVIEKNTAATDTLVNTMTDIYIKKGR